MEESPKGKLARSRVRAWQRRIEITTRENPLVGGSTGTYKDGGYEYDGTSVWKAIALDIWSTVRSGLGVVVTTILSIISNFGRDLFGSGDDDEHIF